ncbi:hypothetical protein WME76_12470 [Sorangium sp. So ce119]|uniref:hypothetical protein n=1 Tax=Sorangium sp. So ce119 TaxID=3133279 RepID=UPI003F5F46F3
MRHTTSFRNVLPLALVALMLVGSVGCGADIEENDGETQQGDGAVEVGQLSSKFGAANVLFMGLLDPTKPYAEPLHRNSENVFKDLYNSDVRQVRQAAYLRNISKEDRRIRGVETTKVNVAALRSSAYAGTDLFLMIHLANCDDPTNDCNDIYADDPSIAGDNFKNRFQAIYDAANPLDANTNQRTINVRTWSINEPDLAMPKRPRHAAYFYKAAHEVLSNAENECVGCILVAGELSSPMVKQKRKKNETPKERRKRWWKVRWLHTYLRTLKTLDQEPKEFGFHPYTDVSSVPRNKYKSHRPVDAETFQIHVQKEFPDARFWLTEVGRVLHLEKYKACEKCGWASGWFVRNTLGTMPLVDRVYWWDMATSQCKQGKGDEDFWDSALADHHGRYRAMYYGLMGYSWKEANLRAQGEPGPWIDVRPRTEKPLRRCP